MVMTEINPVIGETDCPCCGKPCPVKLSRKKKPYSCCTDIDCGYQGFTRGEGAAINMRQKMRAAPPPVVAPSTPESEETEMPAAKKAAKKTAAKKPAKKAPHNPREHRDEEHREPKEKGDDFENWLGL